MTSRDGNGRPAKGDRVNPAGDVKFSTIVPPHADVFGLTREQSDVLHRWIADANGAAPDRLALVAVVETPNGSYRRRVLLSLDAAHRALARAAERGLDARVVLCELVPVRGEAE